jgi:acetoin utilization deacetylase AcuC-like enzyme
MWDPDAKRTEMYINVDTYYCQNTYKAALAAAKTTITATDYILSHTRASSFAVIRPPGHHSGLKSQPHGFSFLNNIALAAHKSLKSKAVSRIAIVDWDVHHG